MKKDRYNLLITLVITFFVLVGFHLSKERPLSEPVQLFHYKWELATDFVADASQKTNHSGEATVNDWEKLFHRVIYFNI